MNLFALSDLHLSFGTPDKSMDQFGEQWREHYRTIQQRWMEVVGFDDVVVIAGDVSWATTYEQAQPDLDWIDQLPGIKIILKGNHDYWWMSLQKLQDRLPDSIIPLHNNSVVVGEYLFFGTRLWDEKTDESTPEDIKIYARELERLKISIGSFPEGHESLCKIGVSHYPPCSDAGEVNGAIELFKNAGAEGILFGHLHGEDAQSKKYMNAGTVPLHLTSCDFLEFTPKRIR